ncbi:hypothetical protein DQ04_00151290 [Trypanosoma grayi]|uniref:hypothetical protein n=1 Tax=Trypanosoma grayi TaxID=71804 RepID=UPI0004F46093|nr:hypothetical protein DQ04_00151290 [Trypanosoma grayi]KEG15210.1 hypothetical protein DQ04_00151290 [Trypanosoma grayi]
MFQYGSIQQAAVTTVLGCFSFALHVYISRLLSGDSMHFAPSIPWLFTTICLQKKMGRGFSIVLLSHITIAFLIYNRFGTSKQLLNRVLLYPAVSSMIALTFASYTPLIPTSSIAVVGLQQMWSILGGLLMLVLFPATFLSEAEPQYLRDERLALLFRKADGRVAERHTIPSRNGITLDAVVVRQSAASNHWIVYFGGNAEMMEDTADDMSGLTDIVRANWVFYNARGVGCSTGYVAEVRDLVEDAGAVVDFVMSYFTIKPGNLLLWGHSIGGGVAAAVARQRCPQCPILLDRTFSRLSDAAVKFSPLPPPLTKQLIRCTAGDLDVVGDCGAVQGKKLVIYHRMDEVIAYDIASLGRPDAFREKPLVGGNKLELRLTNGQSPHNSLLSSFDSSVALRRYIEELLA